VVKESTAGPVAQVAEHWLSRHKVLGSNPQKNNKKKTGVCRRWSRVWKCNADSQSHRINIEKEWGSGNKSEEISAECV
jgi:hypothetical protein